MTVARLDIDFSDRRFIANPFPVYEDVRRAGTVVWNGTLGVWMVPSFDDCVELLGDPHHFPRFTDRKVVFWHDAPNMITVEGAEHHRLRRYLSPFFSRSAIAKLEQRIEDVVDLLLDPLVSGEDSYDLIADFTTLPTIIVAEMLGVPEERHQDFRRWSSAIIGNVAFGHEADDVRQVMRQALQELDVYFAEEIARHRCRHYDDLFGAMLAMADMSDAEMRSTAQLLLISGYDTTAKLMAETLVALEAHPDQRRRLASDPTLMPQAIEEVLRWHGASQMTPRVVASSTTFSGTQLQTGDVVYVLLLAANRDPHRWSRPEEFDIFREPKSHLGFGFGHHLCLGAALARLETRVATNRLLQLVPEYSLRGIDYGTTFFVRGPEKGLIEGVVQAAG